MTQEQIDAGELDLAWTWQSNTREEEQVISIIIDGAVAAIASKALYPTGTIDWSGANGGSFGGASTAVAVNAAGTGNLVARAFQSGTINLDTGLAFYADTGSTMAGSCATQLTSPPSVG